MLLRNLCWTTPPQSGRPVGKVLTVTCCCRAVTVSRNHSTKGSLRQRASARRSVMHPSDRAPQQKAVLGQSETEVVIRPFDPLTAIRADWTAFHAYRRAHHEEASPDDPILTDEQVEEDERDPDPEEIGRAHV